jgi:hypothetical protein
MNKSEILFKSLISLIVFGLLFSSVSAQKQEKSKPLPAGKPVMWEPVNIAERDLFWGPGGEKGVPDLSRVTFIEKEKHGYNTKYRIKDGAGRVWVTKYGREAQPETVAVRLLWALGYKTEINYLVPTITIPGKGTFENVRLEARPENIKRLDEWDWKDNPFTGSSELQGLKLMMVFLNNWDIGDFQNKILRVKGPGDGELDYIISDLGASFGTGGSNDFPYIWRLGRSINKPTNYLDSKFILGVGEGRMKLAFNGRFRKMFEEITVEQGRWLANLLNQLTDRQIDDALRAARYSEDDRTILKHAIKNRIAELNGAVRPAFAGSEAGNQSSGNN